ncbi:MAG: hypothetical protein EBS38_05650 [Actinobacteria bacterium]|nr:hypothetical protein [Actinomycetota bacterium]
MPSVNGSTHVDGTPAKYFENWQQGVCIISINEDNEPFFEMVQIKNGEAWFRGQRFVAKVK